MNTLLIPAHPQTRQLLCETLQRRGHKLTVVEDAEAACAAIQSGGFRLVVIETDGPDGDAALLCRRLRALSQDGHCLILAAGPSPRPEEVDSLLAAGADDYLDDLDDKKRLEVRLAVAEHRVRTADAEDVTGHKQADEALKESEERFRAVFDHAADGILVADVETRQFCAGNRAICDMLGYSQEEIRRLRVKDIHPEEDLPYVIQRFEEQVRQEQALATDIPVRRKDGSVFYADISSFPITLAGKTHLAGIFRDITERKQTEEALRQSEQRLRRVLENMPVMLDAFDADGTIVAWNHECERVTGYRADEIVGNPKAMEWLYPDDAYRQQMVQAWRQRGDDYRGWEWEITCKDGSSRTVAWSNISKHFPVRDWVTWGIGVDVTEQKEMIRRLHDSDARYRLIADNVSDLIWMGRLEGFADFAQHAESSDLAQVAEELMRRWQFTYVSPSVARLLGYDVDQALSLKFEEFLPTDSYAYATQVLLDELAIEQRQPGGRRERMLELKHRTKDGSIRWVELTTTFWRDPQGHPIGLLGVTRDVTQRKQAEEAVRQSEAKLRGLFENLPDFVLIVDRDATIQFVNHDALATTAEELIGSNTFSFIAPEYQPPCREAFHQALTTHRTQSVETLDVVGQWWSIRLVPMIEEDEVRNVMVICTDVTNAKTAAQAVQKEQQLLRHLLDLHERDRQVTAYEIHDGFSQYLTAALYNLQGFRELQANKPQEAWATFDAGLSLICRSINEARRLIGGLRPPILDESGIVAAVDYLACETEESGEVAVEFVHDVNFGRLASPLESAIFRIIQESLTNARRHSRSAKIRIELRQAENHIQIDVRDWGVGFDPTRVVEGRFGLQGIRERARLFGGQVSIETGPHQGTHISVVLPLVETAGEPSGP